jgi:hypothetical protein
MAGLVSKRVFLDSSLEHERKKNRSEALRRCVRKDVIWLLVVFRIGKSN